VQVRELFVRVNRELAPTGMHELFERYIEHSIEEELGRIPEYYGERAGGFWVVELGEWLVGMFGLEWAADDAVELRRMYLSRGHRGQGLGRALLDFAEGIAVRKGFSRMIASTSEIQHAARSLYRSSGYRLVREEVTEQASNRTIGAGLRRFHFEKSLRHAQNVDDSLDRGWFERNVPQSNAAP
jgi:putative acetyltransferase